MADLICINKFKNMPYTGKGDDGMTEIIGAGQNLCVSKTDRRVEALGALDELNSLLGLCKAKIGKKKLSLEEHGSLKDLLYEVQKDLSVILAELAGVNKSVSLDRVGRLEAIIDSTEKEMPTIKSFIVPGSFEISAYLDLARAVARRAERRIIAIEEGENLSVSKEAEIYINRLSDLLFVFARLTDYKFGIKEKQPGESKDK